jgi:hypothetical protein
MNLMSRTRRTAVTAMLVMVLLSMCGCYETGLLGNLLGGGNLIDNLIGTGGTYTPYPTGTTYYPQTVYPQTTYPQTTIPYPQTTLYDPTDLIQSVVDYRQDVIDASADGWDDFIRQ